MRLPPQIFSRGRLSLIVALVLCLAGAADAGPFDNVAESMVNWQIGFDNQFHASVWTPVSVDLTNRARPTDNPGNLEDFHGSISVEVESGSGRNYVFSKDLELPPNSRKHFVFYGRFPDAGPGAMRPSAKIVLRDEKRRELRRESLPSNALPPTQPLAVWVTESPSSIIWPARYGSRTLGRAWTAAENLPDRWYGYQGVTVLVIPRLERNRLSPEQETAIVKWVEMGGHLLVLGGRDAETYAKSFLETKFRLHFYELESLTLPRNPLGPNPRAGAGDDPNFTVDIAPLRVPGGKPLLRRGPKLLAARVERGLGAVDVWAFNLTNRETANIPLVRMLWEAPIGAARPPAQVGHLGMHLKGGNATFKRDEGLKAPSVPLIILILIAYFVVVGPVNFIVLGRRKKLEWAWFTLPVIIVGFSAGIYAIGVMTKGMDRIVRHYSLVECRLNQPVGQLNSALSLWSSSRRAYLVDPESPDAVVVDQDKWYGGGWHILNYVTNPFNAGRTFDLTDMGASKGRSSLQFSVDKMQIDALEMNQWDLSFINLQEPLDLGAGFQGKVNWRTSMDGVNQLRGEIVNKTPYRFEDVYLMTTSAAGATERTSAYRTRRMESGLRGQRLGDWDPDEKISLDPANHLSSKRTPLNALRPGRDGLGGGSDEQEFRKRVLDELLQSRFEQADGQRRTQRVYERQDHTTAYLCGWCVKPLKRATVSPQPTAEGAYSLFIIDLSPTERGDSYRLDGWAMRPVLSDMQAGGNLTVPVNPEDPERGIGIYNNGFWLGLHPPPQSLPAAPGQMNVACHIEDESPNDEIFVLIYNYRTGLREDTDTRDVNTRRQQPPLKDRYLNFPSGLSRDYVNPFSGEILFNIFSRKIQNQGGYSRGTEFRDLEVTLEISPEEVTLEISPEEVTLDVAPQEITLDISPKEVEL